MGIQATPDLKTAWQLATSTLANNHPDVTVLSRCSKRFGLTFDIANG
jgi:hypothetical protein